MRDVRRRAASITGRIEWQDGRTQTIDAASLAGAPERALQVLSAAVVLLAVALVLMRVT